MASWELVFVPSTWNIGDPLPRNQPWRGLTRFETDQMVAGHEQLFMYNLGNYTLQHFDAETGTRVYRGEYGRFMVRQATPYHVSLHAQHLPVLGLLRLGLFVFFALLSSKLCCYPDRVAIRTNIQLLLCMSVFCICVGVAIAINFAIVILIASMLLSCFCMAFVVVLITSAVIVISLLLPCLLLWRVVCISILNWLLTLLRFWLLLSFLSWLISLPFSSPLLLLS